MPYRRQYAIWLCAQDSQSEQPAETVEEASASQPTPIATPAVLLPALREYVAWLVHIDITSISALIVFMTAFLLSWYGFVNRQRFFTRAGRTDLWHSVVEQRIFPDGFTTLCVNLGLLGTILSITLSTVSKTGLDRMANPRSAQDIFVILCASLISTLVGLLVALLVVPALEWINAVATGQYPSQTAPVTDVDVDEALDALMTRVRGLGQVMSELDAGTSRLVAVAPLASICAEMGRVSINLELGQRTFGQLATTLQTACASLGTATDHLGKIGHQLTPLPDMGGQLKQMESATKELVAICGETSAAQHRLAKVLSDLGQPVGLLGDILRDSLSILAAVKEAVNALVTGQSRQTNDLARIGSGFQGLAEALDNHRREVAALIAQSVEAERRAETRQETLQAEVRAVRDSTRGVLEQLRRSLETLHSKQTAAHLELEKVCQLATAKDGPAHRRWRLPWRK